MFEHKIHEYLESNHAELLTFWTEGKSLPNASLEAHCDMFYSLVLLGLKESVSGSAVNTFLELLRKRNLPGWAPINDSPVTLVHNCAYAFGVLNLISPDPSELYNEVLRGRKEKVDSIIDPLTHKPIFPKIWSHHSWRVSHWVGGIPSMVLSVARSGCAGADRYEQLLSTLRTATDELIDHETGLLRTYKSSVLQFIFRQLYAARHNPELGDVGGVAHILWFDHVIGRRYVCAEKLVSQARTLFHRHTPFMERNPYCLDFDIIQIVRTASKQTNFDVVDVLRAATMKADLEQFFYTQLSKNYTLHKFAGALATYHECCLITGESAFGKDPVDIIKSAHWL